MRELGIGLVGIIETPVTLETLRLFRTLGVEGTFETLATV